MSNWWKKEGCSDTVFERRIKKRKWAASWRTGIFAWCRDSQQTGHRVSSCICLGWQWAFPISSRSTYKKRSLVSVNEMMLNWPQGASAAWFVSQAPGKSSRQEEKKEKKRKSHPLPAIEIEEDSFHLLCPPSPCFFPLFSPAIPPAGRCNLLPFTPCQTMTRFSVMTQQPTG